MPISYQPLFYASADNVTISAALDLQLAEETSALREQITADALYSMG